METSIVDARVSADVRFGSLVVRRFSQTHYFKVLIPVVLIAALGA
jgi:hypothetical protein